MYVSLKGLTSYIRHEIIVKSMVSLLLFPVFSVIDPCKFLLLNTFPVSIDLDIDTLQKYTELYSLP